MGNLFNFTGNPFVDSGLWGIMAWLKKRSPEDIETEEVIAIFKDIADLYTTPEWKKLMYYLFPNNPITNPSYKGKHKEQFLGYLYRLVGEIDEVENDSSCISCGRRGVITKVKRKDVPLTGSGTLRNYFSYAQEGADYCPVCTLAIQFLPLTTYVCGGKVILISSDSNKVMRIWSKKCRDLIDNQILSRNYDVGVNENYLLAQNALFHIVGEMIIERGKRESFEEKVSIRIYYFTNYGQSADIEIFDLPSSVFSFLVKLKQINEYNKWFEVVNRGFVKKLQDKDERYRKFTNVVYNNLLKDKSIITYFIDSKEKKVFATWNILKIYMKEVRRMDSQRLELIKKLGGKIAETIKVSGKKNRLVKIENAEKYNKFLEALIHISKDRISNDFAEPLLILDEFAEIVYQENYPNWWEVKYLILFEIYDELYDWLQANKETEEEEEQK